MWGSRCRTCAGWEGAEALWGPGAQVAGGAGLGARGPGLLPPLVCRPCLRHLHQVRAFTLRCRRVQALFLAELAANRVRQKSDKEKSIPPRDLSKKVRILPKLTPSINPISNSTLLLIDRPPAESTGLTNTIIIPKNAARKQSDEAVSARLHPSPSICACKKCDKIFISEKCLQIHAEQFHRENFSTKSCSTCGTEFPSFEELTRHNLKVHFPSVDPDCKVSCEYCEKIYKNKYLLARHRKKAHAREATSKYLCGKRNFSNVSKIPPRPAAAVDDSNFACDVCGLNFQNAKILESHSKSHALYDCNFCDRVFLESAPLSDHMAKHGSDDDPFSCAICDKMFPNKEDLHKHKYETHQIGRETFFCGPCSNGEFYSLPDLTKHVWSTHSSLSDAKYSVSDENVYELILQTPADVEHSYLSLDPEGVKKSIDDDLLIPGENRMDGKDKFIMVECIEEDSNGNIFDSQMNELTDDKCYSGETVHVKDEIRNKLTDILNKPVDNYKEDFTDFIDDSVLNESDRPAILNDVLASDYNLKHHSIDDPIKDEVVSNTFDIKENNFESLNLPSDKNDDKIKKMRNNGIRDIKKYNVEELSENNTNSLLKKDITNLLKKKSKVSQNDKEFQCCICPKKFLRIFNLQKHMMVHQNESLHCVGCGSEFADQNNLKQHIRQCRSLRSTGNLKCTVCGKVLTSATGLKYHLKAHAGIRKHACSLCQRQFLTPSNLKSHWENIHSQFRPYKCTLCPRTFSSRDHLRKHAGVHTHQRDHVCCVCGQRFKQSSHLSQHMLIHTGARPHACKYCTNKYSTKGSLTKHLRRNHLEQQNEASLAEKQSGKEDLEMITDLETNAASLSEDGLVLLDDDFTDGLNVVIIVEDRDTI